MLDAPPRAASALLRTLIEELVIALNAQGDSLYNRIRFLVQNGLDVRVQQMLDTVRFIGNDAVHPGKLDDRDDLETAATLFWLVNEITSEMITRPKRIAVAYNRIPAEQRQRIDQRDNRGGGNVG